MKRRGRPLRGAISGLLFGGFLGADLFVFGVVPLDSVILTLAPVLGLVVGLLLGFTAPFGGANAPAAADSTPAPEAAPVDASVDDVTEPD